MATRKASEAPQTPEFEDGEETQPDPDTDFQQAANSVGGDISQRAWEWLEKKRATELEITSILYREKKEGGKVQCGKWKNQIPDEHSIGLVHGQGRYSLLVTYPKHGKNPPGVWRREFELDKHYDTLKQEAEMMGAIPTLGRLPVQQMQPCQPPAVRDSERGNDTLEIIKALLPILQPPQKQDNTMAQMMQMYQMMGFVMKKSLLDQQEFLANIQEKMLENMIPQQADTLNPNGEAPMSTETAEKPKSFIEQVLPYVMPLIEKMASGNPAEKTATAAFVNSIPAVKEIMTDPKHKEDCGKLIQYMDKQLKPVKTDEILKALKVDRTMYA